MVGYGFGLISSGNYARIYCLYLHEFAQKYDLKMLIKMKSINFYLSLNYIRVNSYFIKNRSRFLLLNFLYEYKSQQFFFHTCTYFAYFEF